MYVTFGTEFAAMAHWRAVLDALGSVDVDAALTVGRQIDPDSLGPRPPGVRIEQWVPQRQALADADLVVSHCGSGAMIGTASVGLPHLALPIAADHFDNADLVSARGIGSMIEPDQVDADAIAGALAHHLGDGGHRLASRDVAADMAAMPTPDATAAVLEQLVGT